MNRKNQQKKASPIPPKVKTLGILGGILMTFGSECKKITEKFKKIDEKDLGVEK